MIRRFLEWLHSFFRRPTAREQLAATVAIPPPFVPPPEPQPETAQANEPARGKRQRTKSANGALKFKADVLDQLKHYMRYIKRMKSYDRPAYDLYSQIGAQIVPIDQLADVSALDPWFRQTLPSFGAVAYVGQWAEDIEATDEKLMPRFMYFQKMARPPHDVQQINTGTLYKMTVFFADSKNDKLNVGVEFPLLVDEGEVRPLMMLHESTQIIRHKRVAPGESVATRISRQRWGIHPLLVEWATQRKRTPVDEARFLFCCLASFYTQNANSMIRVEAADKNVMAVFNVDILHTPEFFNDREKIKAASGRTAPIFHIVRPHRRTLPSGKTIGIKAHFAGLARFMWNGYAIGITVPGKDHASIADATFGVYSEETLSPSELDSKEWVEADEVGSRLARAIAASRK
jgi:hypothetical protein